MAALPFNWGQYLGDGTATGGARDNTFTTQQGWQQALDWVKQFDPNASIMGTQTPTGDQGQYLSFNNSLPRAVSSPAESVPPSPITVP